MIKLSETSNQVGVDALFLGLCLNICAHFDILRNSLKDFDGDTKKFVSDHQTVLDLAENLNHLFKPIVFAQFAISSMLLCVLGFQIVMVENFFKKIIFIGFGFSVIIQLFSYSFGGQLIKDKSSAVADHLYAIKKDIVIIIARSQKPIEIAAGIYEANLPTFRLILSSAGSWITLLKSLVE